MSGEGKMSCIPTASDAVVGGGVLVYSSLLTKSAGNINNDSNLYWLVQDASI